MIGTVRVACSSGPVARRFVTEAGEIMRRAGWTEGGGKSNGKANGRANGKAGGETQTAEARGSSIYGRTALRDECAKLAVMEKDSGRNNALNSAAFSVFQLVARRREMRPGRRGRRGLGTRHDRERRQGWPRAATASVGQ